MEARGAAQARADASRADRPLTLPAWLLGLGPLLAILAALGALLAFGVPGLGERRGPPAEELVVERTVLKPNLIELSLRNDGPDPVQIAQVTVNDSFASFELTKQETGRLRGERLSIAYPWVEAEAYEIGMITSAGGVIAHTIDVAVETPSGDLSFYGLMALLGIYVGVIPVALGMLWLPWLRRISARWIQGLMALTVGLLAFLAMDAMLEGLRLAGAGSQALGGTSLVLLGAAASYLALTAVDAWLRGRHERAKAASAPGAHVAMLIATGIGLHNLGEGLAIGSSYAIGALALGTFLVVGFALHNTTEGLAIVAPLAGERVGWRRLALLGLVAGGPAILGAWIGASAFNAALAAFLFGAGVGAIIQVIQQLLPSIRDVAGRALHPVSIAGIATGIAMMYATGLLVSV